MQDIRVDQNFDLIIDNGDFSVGFSDINKMIELDGIDGITVGITESGITIYSDGL